MHKLNLMLHCGANEATREQVQAIKAPSPTDTWHPIPHVALIDMLMERLDNYGMQVIQEAHGLFSAKKGEPGDRYFGMFQVGNEDDKDFSLVFGLRNSHDKTFPAGLCLGSGVFVCDNLAFSAEVVIGRRHTTHILRDLPQLVSTAVGKLVQARVDQARRLEAYKEHEISNQIAQSLIVDAFRAAAINTTRIPKVLEQWYDPKHPEFKERTVWSLFNAFTEVLKNSSLVELPKRTTVLHGVLDNYCDLITDVNEAIKNDANVVDAEFEIN